MSWKRAIEQNMTVAQMRSKRNVGSGCERYMVSRALFRYHIVTGWSSRGAPQHWHSVQYVSTGNKFDSIIAMLCVTWEDDNQKLQFQKRLNTHSKSNIFGHLRVRNIRKRLISTPAFYVLCHFRWRSRSIWDARRGYWNAGITEKGLIFSIYLLPVYSIYERIHIEKKSFISIVINIGERYVWKSLKTFL